MAAVLAIAIAFASAVARGLTWQVPGIVVGGMIAILLLLRFGCIEPKRPSKRNLGLVVAGAAVLAVSLVLLCLAHPFRAQSYEAELETILSEKYGSEAAVVEVADADNMFSQMATVCYRVALDGREGSAWVDFDGEHGTFKGDDLQEEELLEAAAVQLLEAAGVPGDALIDVSGYTGSFVPAFHGGDAVAFMRGREFRMDAVYESDPSADFRPLLSESVSGRVLLFGVNDMFSGSLESLHDIYSGADHLGEEYAIDSLLCLSKDGNYISSPAEEAVIYGGDSFDEAFRPIDSLQLNAVDPAGGSARAALDVVFGPYEYVGPWRTSLKVYVPSSQADSWIDPESPLIVQALEQPSGADGMWQREGFRGHAWKAGPEAPYVTVSLGSTERGEGFVVFREPAIRGWRFEVVNLQDAGTQ